MEETNVGIQEVLNDLDEGFLDNGYVQDNKICFPFNDSIYRVRMPDQKEFVKAKEKMVFLKNRLLQEKGNLVKKKLKKILKENQDIDIDKMQETIDELEKKILEIYVLLAPCVDTEVKTITKFKDQIKELRKKRIDIVIEMTKYLASSVEVQAEDAQIEYLTFCCTEKFESKEVKGGSEEKWVPVWNNLEEFEKDLNRNLRLTSTGWLSHLLLNN